MEGYKQGHELIMDVTRFQDEAFMTIWRASMEAGYIGMHTIINGFNTLVVARDERDMINRDYNVLYARFIWNCYSEGKTSPYMEVYMPYDGSTKTYPYNVEMEYIKMSIENKLKDYEKQREAEMEEALEYLKEISKDEE